MVVPDVAYVEFVLGTHVCNLTDNTEVTVWNRCGERTLCFFHINF